MVDVSAVLIISLNVLTFVFLYTLIALGLMIIFGLMKVINMAHGEMIMIGAYITQFSVASNLGFWVGLLLAAVSVGALGMLMELSVIRRLYKRSDLSTLLATWGFSIIFAQSFNLAFGFQRRFVPPPIQGTLDILGVTYPLYYVLVMMLSAVTILAVVLLFYKTRLGLMARATIYNPEMASALGINVSRMYLFSFALGAGLAGLAGGIISPLVAVLPTMGADFIGRSFFIVILGGLGNILGTVGAGAVIGGTETGLASTLPQGYFGSSPAVIAQVVVLVLVILMMLLRPEGLFQRRG